MLDDDKVEKHPSFGAIGVSKVSGNAYLFGSDARHHHFVQLTISRAERRRSLSNEVKNSVYLIADTHFNHNKIATYCDRPENFTDTLIRNWIQTVKPDDLLIHLGDVFMDKVDGWEAIWPRLTGRKMLIRGNHDKRGSTWWLRHGFDTVVDAAIFRGAWLTHRPSEFLPLGCTVNIHGHLHNVWHGFCPENGLQFADTRQSWHRLFAVEYTNYMPIEFDKFVSHPDRYQARGKKE